MTKRLSIPVAATLEFALSAIPQGQGYTLSAFGEDYPPANILRSIAVEGGRRFQMRNNSLRLMNVFVHILRYL